MEEVMDVREAAAYLRINEQTLRRMARDGTLPAFKVGRIWRFKRSTLDQWAEKQQTSTGGIDARGEDAGGGGGRRVLVVDDQKDIHYMLHDILTAEGYEVESAFNGEEALEWLPRYRPDLILLDLRMPVMSGPEALREIRRRFPELPVVILTGYPDSDMVHDVLELTPVTLLSKPCTRKQLLDCVQRGVGVGMR